MQMTIETDFKVGDLVTRDGTDVQRVIEADEGYGNITVVCVKAPLGWPNDDGTHGEPWCKVGDVESNLARRYSFAGDIVEGEVVEIAGKLTPPPQS
jgi:hypothetical protein